MNIEPSRRETLIHAAAVVAERHDAAVDAGNPELGELGGQHGTVGTDPGLREGLVAVLA